MLQHPDKLKKIEETWKNEIGDSMYMTISKPFFLEFMNKEVDKSKSIERLAKILGISMLEVIAIGDSYNDLSMIKAAGLGVAMYNAVDCVKAAANYTTDDNEHDGVAKVCDQKYYLPQHFLYFFPDPHGHGSFLPIFLGLRIVVDSFCSL